MLNATQLADSGRSWMLFIYCCSDSFSIVRLLCVRRCCYCVHLHPQPVKPQTTHMYMCER